MSSLLSFSVSRPVSAPLEDVWNVIGDFGTEHRWTASLKHCQRSTPDVRVGTVRTCTLPRPLMGRTEVQEELIEYVRGAALAYRLDGSAGPFATASSRWSTRVLSPEATLRTIEGRFTPKSALGRAVLWPLAKPFLRGLTFKIIRELEAFLLAGRARASVR